MAEENRGPVELFLAENGLGIAGAIGLVVFDKMTDALGDLGIAVGILAIIAVLVGGHYSRLSAWQMRGVNAAFMCLFAALVGFWAGGRPAASTGRPQEDVIAAAKKRQLPPAKQLALAQGIQGLREPAIVYIETDLNDETFEYAGDLEKALNAAGKQWTMARTATPEGQFVPGITIIAHPGSEAASKLVTGLERVGVEVRTDYSSPSALVLPMNIVRVRIGPS